MSFFLSITPLLEGDYGLRSGTPTHGNSNRVLAFFRPLAVYRCLLPIIFDNSDRQQLSRAMAEILIRNKVDKDWKPVESAEYSNEAELQRLLEETPSLIPVTHIQAQASALVVAVSEVGLPGSGNTDLICFSSAGDIAVIECKLATNTEIKRKVIGQILEYGAYLWGMAYEELDRRIQRIRGMSMADLVNHTMSGASESSGARSNWDEEAFRENVRESLANGTFLLIIAVDQINDELERTINFLNTCGRPAFSFHALAIQRFKAADTEILVPHLYGPPLPTKPGKQRWTEERFFNEIKKELDPEVCQAIEGLYQWSKNTANQVMFGTGKEVGSFTFYYLRQGKLLSVFSVSTQGNLTVNYGSLNGQIENPILDEFHRSITRIPSLSAIPADFNKWPSVKISQFILQPTALQNFKEAVKGLELLIATPK
jgi:hypothetical protein